jgi:phosphate transport system permease protein
MRPSRIREKLIEALIFLCGVSAIIFVFGIFLFIFLEGAPFLFRRFDPGEFFGGLEWRPEAAGTPTYGALALLVGSFTLTAIAMLLAVPFGLGAAIFLSEFCGGKLKEVLKVVIELLAAIPSVVWGFVGITVINNLLIRFAGAQVGVNVLNGGVVIGLMSVPIIVSLGEDALRAVPDAYREAAVALGATRWQLTWRVLLPAARNGLLGAVLLGVGRAVGETIAVYMCTGHAINIPFDGTFPYFHALEPVRTITATIAAEMGEAAKGSTHYQALFVLGILLFAITFAINLTADLVVRGVRRR